MIKNVSAFVLLTVFLFFIDYATSEKECAGYVKSVWDSLIGSVFAVAAFYYFIKYEEVPHNDPSGNK